MKYGYEYQDPENQIDYLLNIFQQIYNNANDGLNGDLDYESVLKNIVDLVKDYVKVN